MISWLWRWFGSGTVVSGAVWPAICETSLAGVLVDRTMTGAFEQRTMTATWERRTVAHECEE